MGQPAEPDDGKFLGHFPLEGSDPGLEGTHKAITSFISGLVLDGALVLDVVLGVGKCNGVFYLSGGWALPRAMASSRSWISLFSFSVSLTRTAKDMA